MEEHRHLLLDSTTNSREWKDMAPNNNEHRAGRRLHRRMHRCVSDGGSVHTKKSRWSAIILGQTIALALTCGNASSSCLANDYQVTIPTVQTGLVYFVLAFHLIYLYYRQKKDVCDHSESRRVIDDVLELGLSMESNKTQTKETAAALLYKFPFTSLTLHAPWHTYALLSVLDVEANYLAMLSFRQTTLSSSMLLTSLSVLSTVALRMCIIRGSRDKIGGRRLIGVTLCLVGGCSWLRREYLRQRDESSDDVVALHDDGVGHFDIILYGDLLALSAACIYGLNDVLAEYCLKQANNTDGVEYVGMLGFFGSLFSLGVQAPLLGEWNQVRTLLRGIMHGDDSTSTEAILSLLLCFVIMTVYFYSSAMRYMLRYDSTSLNLSVQTGPLWAVILTMSHESLSVEGNIGVGWAGFPPAMFFVSFSMIVLGVFLYESSNAVNETSCCVAEDDDGRMTVSRKMKSKILLERYC